MAVGFIDRLRLLNIMIDDIKVFYEFTIKAAKEIAFSHGGHLFAAADQTIIKVYHTTTFENAYNLKGATIKTKISHNDAMELSGHDVHGSQRGGVIN